MSVSAAQLKAKSKFETKVYDKILIRIRKDRLDDSGLSREMIQKAADAAGESMNEYILKAVSNRINQ